MFTERVNATGCVDGELQWSFVLSECDSAQEGLMALAQGLSDELTGSVIFSPPSTKGL